MTRNDARSAVQALIPIYGITMIDVFGYMIMIPLLPYLAKRYGASGVEVGALLATMAVAGAIAAPFWGALSDKIGRKPVVLVSQVVSLIGYVGLAISPSLGALFVARGIAGIGGGNLGVTQSYIADVTSSTMRDKAYALFGVVYGVGIVLGPVTGGLLVRSGYETPFLVAAGIEIVNICLTLRFLPGTREKKPESPRFNLRHALHVVGNNPDVRSLVARHFLFIFAVTYFFTIFALYVRDVLRFGPEQASWLLAGTGVVGGAMLAIVVNPLVKRLGDVRVAQLGLALSAFAYAGLFFVSGLWTFVGVLIVWAAGASCIEPTLSALLSMAAPERDRGLTMGFSDTLNNVALMVAPSLGGFMIDRDLRLVGSIPALAVIGAFVLGMFARALDTKTLRAARNGGSPQTTPAHPRS